MVNLIAEFTPGCFRTPELVTFVAAGGIPGAVDLVIFCCMTITGLVLMLSVPETIPQNFRRGLAGLLILSGTIHFLDFWHGNQPMILGTVLTGSLAAVTLAMVTGALYSGFQAWQRGRSEDSEQALQAARQQLSREEHLMPTLVDNMPDCIYFKDRESRFIRCNQRTAEIFGLSGPHEVVGRSDHDFFSQEEADEYRADEVRIMQTGEPIINKEEYELWPDGEHHWVLSTKMPLRDAENNVIGTFGLSRDVSQLKRAEQQLAAKVAELQALHEKYTQGQNLFSTLIENLPDAVYFKDRESRFLRVNPAMARDAGLESPDDMIGLTDTDVWGAEQGAAARADDQRIMQTDDPIIGKQEEITRRSDGQRRWVLATKMPLHGGDGEIIGTFGLARDITSLKQTQQWLSDSQERFELAAQGTTDGLWDWNAASDEVWYGPRFRELLGFASTDTLEFPNALSSFTDRLHPDDYDRVVHSMNRHLETGEAHDEEYRLKIASGDYHWFHGRGQATWDENGQTVRMAGSIQDIHQRHVTQQELERTRLQLQHALQGGNVGMWDWNILTNEVDVSPELMTQIGKSPDESWTSLQDWEDHLHPDDRIAAIQRTQDYIDGVIDNYESSFRLRRADGRYGWILSRGMLFRDEHGKPSRFIGVHVDVTELREAEQALATSEAKFRGIFNQTFQFIGLLTPEGVVLDANRTALERIGIASDEVIGRDFWDTVWWAHSAELQERLKQAVRKAAAGEFDRFEATHQAGDGSVVYVDFSLKPVRDDSGRIVYLIPEGRDITERKKYQDELQVRSEELEHSNRELEQFAYVASHDLQEPLRTVVGFCQLLEMEYQGVLDDNGRMYLDTIVEGGKRMQRLVSDLLEYSRVGSRGKPFRLVPLGEVVEEALALLHSSITDAAARIEVGDLPSACVDPEQMTRLFQNLIGNALKYRGPAVPQIRIWSEDDTHCFKIYVADNGIGIDEEFSEQVFVIFRRLHTREEYPGTGIGLAICRRIVERHGGQIRIVYGDHSRTSPDSGVTFEITLPKTPPAQITAEPAAAAVPGKSS